jgi:AcrR family transcriptional regulator
MSKAAADLQAPETARRGRYAKTWETQEKILAAAWDVAQERGFHRISLSEVANRADVAVGNVSYHFGSRRELVRSLMRSVADRVMEHVISPTAGGRDYFERAEAGLRGYLDFVHRHPAYVRMVEQVRHHRPEIHLHYLGAWLELHQSAIRQGIDEGTLRSMSDGEIATTARFIIGVSYSLDQMIESLDGNDYPGDDVVVETFMKMLRGGLERIR